MRTLIVVMLAAVLALPAVAAAADPSPLADLSDSNLRTALRRTERDLETYHRLAEELDQSEKASSNSARATVIDALQEDLIAMVLHREDALGVEHTIIRHGQPPTGPTSAAKVGDPNANKETRRRIRKGTSDKPDAFLRLVRMQQAALAGERLYRLAVERQPGAFAAYRDAVHEFGSALQEERDELAAEVERRDSAAAEADSLAAAAAATAESDRR